eukprot:gene68014-93187_t
MIRFPLLHVAAFLLAAFAFPMSAFSERSSVHAHILVDAAAGKVLEGQNAEALGYPASLTKMMTLYLTFEALRDGKFDWDQRLLISENANSKEPYKFAVGAGNSITVREAVMGMVVLSTNDAATAVAEALGGSEEAFGRMMTAKGRAL